MRIYTKYLVTGGAGLAGSNIVKQFSKQGKYTCVNSVLQKSIINTNMDFAEGKPHFWKRKQVVKKTYGFFVPPEESLENYYVQVGLWDHK